MYVYVFFFFWQINKLKLKLITVDHIGTPHDPHDTELTLIAPCP